jgi:hypothetical protein
MKRQKFEKPFQKEDESDKEDDEPLMSKAFPVKGTFDPVHGPPKDGFEYLSYVR